MVTTRLPARRAYHHGDLRAALIDEGLRLLEAAGRSDDPTAGMSGGGPASLSLREIARNVGVSATAVYRHFPDKDALLSALAEHGLELLAQRKRAVLARSHGKAGFAALGRSYVRFALAHPGLYRLIFTHLNPGASTADSPLANSPQGSAAWLLREQVAQALGPAATEEKIEVTALRAWALVHGLSMLILDRQLGREAAEAMIDAIVSVEAIGLG